MHSRFRFNTLAIAAFSLTSASAATAQSLAEIRMTPAEIQSSALDDNQIGSSGLPGIHTKVVFGDPHFAQTGTEPVIVQISGYGPTDTHYFEAVNEPKAPAVIRIPCGLSPMRR